MVTMICTYVSEISAKLSNLNELCKLYVTSKQKENGVGGAVSWLRWRKTKRDDGS